MARNSRFVARNSRLPAHSGQRPQFSHSNRRRGIPGTDIVHTLSIRQFGQLYQAYRLGDITEGMFRELLSAMSPSLPNDLTSLQQGRINIDPFMFQANNASNNLTPGGNSRINRSLGSLFDGGSARSRSRAPRRNGHGRRDRSPSPRTRRIATAVFNTHQSIEVRVDNGNVISSRGNIRLTDFVESLEDSSGNRLSVRLDGNSARISR